MLFAFYAIMNQTPFVAVAAPDRVNLPGIYRV